MMTTMLAINDNSNEVKKKHSDMMMMMMKIGIAVVTMGPWRY